jgi:4-hydroxythreonine-4-phosphate dehydrogenase
MPENLKHNEEPLVIGITMGEPMGIGPEIIVKALYDPFVRRGVKFIIFGMDEFLEYAADKAEIEPFWGRCQHEKINRDFPRNIILADYDDYSIPMSAKCGPSKAGGESSLRFCTDAIEAAKAGIIDAVVTAPISKVSWNLAGAEWPGHTELLAAKCKSPRKVMMFAAGPLKIALATIHIAISDIKNKFTIGSVYEPIDLLNTALKEYFGIKNPHIAVAALNPHAGENGQFGDEEQRIITPAMLIAQEMGIKCSGPYPADTLFAKAAAGEFDGVIAMYHDQGMIPVKLLAFKDAVNVTIGLPIIRTSPAHGTAFDIAGKGAADESSMKAAIKLAIDMARTRRQNTEVRIQNAEVRK